MKYKVVLVLCVAVILTGCVHSKGVHMIPMERDYGSLEKACAKDACEVVKKAHRVGAHNFAPYEYTASELYAKWAMEERKESHYRAEWDFAKLASKYADEAIAKGSGIPDQGEMKMPAKWEEAKAELDRLIGKYRQLDACRARLVAPVVYAHVEANLSAAEEEILEKCHYPEGVRDHLRFVEADIDAILAKDTDNDGIKDMVDGDPWIPEDKDNYEDQDGIPEPKPYPVLTPVHFATNSAKLSGEAVGYLTGIAKMLLDGYKEVTVYIDGHTDSDASEKYNLDLSKRRVDAVEKCLVDKGAKNEMVKSTFQGETKPVADNKTAKGKAANRRVEIKLDSPDVKTPYPCTCGFKK